MRIFGKTTCMLCRGDAGMGSARLIEENEICRNCVELCDLPRDVRLKSLPLEQVENAYKKALRDEVLNQKFAVSRSNKYIEIDAEEKMIRFPSTGTRLRAPRIYSFNDIIQFEVVEDGETITSGGLGRAIFGGALLGPLGAVVGGITGGKRTKGVCEQLDLKIDINDVNYPNYTIAFVNKKMKKKSFIFKRIAKEMQETLSLMNYVAENGTVEDTIGHSSALSSADEIRGFKSLLDDGIITKEEFEEKKKDLLK